MARDKLITLIGGGGFLGRYVAQELLRTGARIRIAQRDPSQAHSLKPLSRLGQTQFVPASITHPASLARAIEGADGVVNLVGILAGDFEAIHVEGARNAATAAAHAGVGSFVQVSAIGADPRAASAYGASKGRGEQAASAAFPAATNIRPSIVFGAEDNFVNRFAAMISRLPAMPVVRPNVRFQPVWAADVARAIAAAALDPEAHGGATYELGGPQALSMAELNRWIAEAIGRAPRQIPLPDAVAGAMARFGGWLPGAPITWDQWLMLQQDNVASGALPGFEAFGFEPKPLAAVAPQWLVRYRREGRFSLNQPA